MNVIKSCKCQAPIVHTGTIADKWIVLEIVTHGGRVLHQRDNSPDDEIDNLTARCTVCGVEISGIEYCAVAYQYPPAKLGKGVQEEYDRM